MAIVSAGGRAVKRPAAHRYPPGTSFVRVPTDLVEFAPLMQLTTCDLWLWVATEALAWRGEVFHVRLLARAVGLSMRQVRRRLAVLDGRRVCHRIYGEGGWLVAVEWQGLLDWVAAARAWVEVGSPGEFPPGPGEQVDMGDRLGGHGRPPGRTPVTGGADMGDRLATYGYGVADGAVVGVAAHSSNAEIGDRVGRDIESPESRAAAGPQHEYRVTRAQWDSKPADWQQRMCRRRRVVIIEEG